MKCLEFYPATRTSAKSAAGQEFLRQLVTLIGAKSDAAEVSQVLAYIANSRESALAFSLVRSLGDGLVKSGTSLAKIDSEGN